MMKLSSILIAAVLSISGGTFAIPVPLYSRALQQPSLLGHDVEVYRRMNEDFEYSGPPPREINKTAPTKSSFKKNTDKLRVGFDDHLMKIVYNEDDPPSVVGGKKVVFEPLSLKRQADSSSLQPHPSVRRHIKSSRSLDNNKQVMR